MEKKLQEIDLLVIFKTLVLHKKVITKFIFITTVLGIIISISIPKTYEVNVTISPESGANESNNGLGNMATILGIGGISGINQDAVNSTMFPQIIQSTPFILEMYNLKIPQKGSEDKITLSKYVNQQSKPWWNYILKIPSSIIKFISSITTANNPSSTLNNTINPFKLTKEQQSTINLIKSSLAATEDTKSGMTIISTKFQDPVVAAIVADSTVKKLQQYIINYRTRKAHEDYLYLEKLCNERKKEYHKAQQAYAKFMDTNKNIISQRTQVEGTLLQNEMNIAFQIYSQVETQLQVARAKIQEAKPVFAIVEPATIPLYPSSPNKKIIILGMIFLGLISASIWILWGKNFWNNLKK